ncbi:EamA/RhaT family transporter [Curtobacterium sp. MCBD17_023]|nr:EamA/RhaT family transporter [Curtobacterium sp. MCBD17_023]
MAAWSSRTHPVSARAAPGARTPWRCSLEWRAHRSEPHPHRGRRRSIVRDERRAGLLAVTVTALLWGTTGTAATFAPDVGPLAIGAAALGVGGILQAVVGARALRAAAPLLVRSRALVLVGAVAVAVYPLAFYSSMHTAGVAVGSVVSLASAPLASGVLERVVDRRPLSRWWVLAAALGVVGSVLLCLSSLAGSADPAGVGSPGSTVLGVVLGLVAGAMYAVYSWASRRLMVDGVPRAAAMGAVFGGGGLLLMPVLAVTGAPLLASPQNAAVGVYMAIVPMFLGYLLFGYGLARIPASTATTVTLTEPAVAAVLAVLVVGERLTAVGWAGLGVIAIVLVVLAVAPTNTRAGSRS